MKALILAGGLPQIELIKQLKARGITTVLADGNANAPAVPYADIVYQIAIFDTEAVKEVAVKEQVDFLTGIGCDMFQGFFFARPMEIEKFEELYLKNKK